MAPSTKIPIEIAIPDSDIRLAFSPIRYIGMKASITLIGWFRMGNHGRGEVPEKEQDDDGHHDHFFDQLSVTRADGAQPMRSERS